MASGYPSGGGGGGGGGDFYNTNTSNGGGSINNVQLHYRSQLAKRSIAESERQHHHQAFLRSVKQRSNNNKTVTIKQQQHHQSHLKHLSNSQPWILHQVVRKPTSNPNSTPESETDTLSPSETSSSSSSSTSVASPSISSTKQSLIDIATAISEGNTETATVTLKTLKQFSNTRGDPQQRLTAYMVSALRSRINPVENPPPVNQLWSKDHIVGTQCSSRRHRVLNSIGQGSQYSTLIHALGERQSGRPTFLKITPVIIDDSGNRDDLVRVDEWLQKIAARAGVTLKFNVVCAKLSELNRTRSVVTPMRLGCEFAFKLYKLADESVSTENPGRVA
ncbi:hypothetical protein GIB67_033891 [Kingdonia uniflora]|uniref:Uncharacterized protein n=1 Tax=Kingdonia uniflora TaxID=39325 RepID=A0A7J7NW84_9MAGN|nr:hypothetical protein GIB67_033891 [Kingdonia uniflora]